MRAPAAWTLVGLGDSVTAGAGCPGCTDFLTLIAQGLHQKTGVAVSAHNFGVDGQTSGGLLQTLQPGGSRAAAVSKADLVIITIGANDLLPDLDAMQNGSCGGADDTACAASDVSAVQRNVSAILARIRALRANQPTAIRVTGYWNVFEDGDVAAGDYTPIEVQASVAVTQQVNAVLRSDAAAGGATYVDLSGPFSHASGGVTSLLSSDGDHPNQRGHEVIAAAVLASGSAPLTP